MSFRESFHNESILNDVELISVPGGDELVSYAMLEGDDVILVTQGVNGKVLNFADGSSTVYKADGEVFTLRSDKSATVVDSEGIDDIPAPAHDLMITQYQEAVQQALVGS
jgi:hypothetical protein